MSSHSFPSPTQDTETRAALPNGPRSRFPGETLFAFQRQRAEYLQALAHTYGDIVYVKLGPLDTFLINHPDLIKQVLVTENRNFRLGHAHQQVRHFFGDGLVVSEGAHHLQQRRMLAPLFHANHITRAGDTTVEFAARWRAERRAGEVIEIGYAMWALTLHIICKSMFNASVADEIEELGRTVYDVTTIFSPMMILVADWMLKLHLPPSGRFRRAQARLDRTMFRLIDEHRASGDTGDLLSLLLHLRDTTDAMTDAQLRDEVLTFFIAGHGTTANMLTWTLYLLSQYPEVEARLHEEIEQVLGERLPTVTDLPKLKYTRGILVEALRLYPPVWGMDRQVVQECNIGGYVLPQHALVLLSQWVTHHDARFFPDPYRFAPERWLDQDPPKYAYFPFSAGPRVCLGEALTWQNGALILTTLAQQWQLRLVPGQQIKPNAGTTLQPQHGIQMRCKART